MPRGLGAFSWYLRTGAALTASLRVVSWDSAQKGLVHYVTACLWSNCGTFELAAVALSCSSSAMMLGIIVK